LVCLQTILFERPCSDQQEAFDKIKLTLTNTPVLAHYDPNRETVLMTDSSKYATGSVVLQKQDNGDLSQYHLRQGHLHLQRLDTVFLKKKH
jgi:hypothetical protein